MNKNFSELFDKRAGDIKPGLERIKKAFEYLGKPSFSIPTVLVAGTNGKGSTAGLLWSMLSAAGYKVGLYSSPHLRDFSERYSLSTKPISDDDVYSEFISIKEELPQDIYAELSFFEIATLISFRLFDKEGCDFQIIEVGLGGRLDATNILDPILSIVVSLSVDHVEFLGSDLKVIAYEKMGIARSHRKLLWGASGEYMDLVDADEYFVSLLPTGSSLWDLSKRASFDELAFTIDNIQYPYPKPLIKAPEFIKRNFILSYKAFKELCSLGYEELMDKTFSSATKAAVTLVGRSQEIELEYKSQKISLYFDVGHNLNGIEEMIKTARKRSVTKLRVLASVLRDKDYESVFEKLEDSFMSLDIFSTDHPRSLSKIHISKKFEDNFYTDFFTLLDELLAKTKERRFVVTGSVLVIGEIMTKLDIDPKQFSMLDIFENK